MHTHAHRALGVVMFIMLVGVHPFDLEGGTSDIDLLRRVASSEARIERNSSCWCCCCSLHCC